ncbi:MAG TPA: hypothetical protein VNN10_00260 [Dehalococcoidia bacterium]|nr:hypothetical protein [Dehalococcoidia bacterium]
MRDERTSGAEGPRPRDKTSAPALPTTDLELRRLAKQARACLQEMLADLCELESVLARFQAFLAVPPEFRRAHNRVA